MTRAPRRRRTGEAVPQAEKFGDLITADHKVLNEDGESRDNHRYAVVVQDLATQWIQIYPCKTMTSQETEKSLSKFLEPSHRPKVIWTQVTIEHMQLAPEQQYSGDDRTHAACTRTATIPGDDRTHADCLHPNSKTQATIEYTLQLAPEQQDSK